MTELNAGTAAEQGAPLAYFTSAKRGGLLVGAGPVFWVAFCGAVWILAIVFGTAMIANNFRDREIDKSKRELENTVRLLVRHFDRQIQGFESIEKSLAAEFEQRVKTPEELRRELATEDVHRILQSKLSDAVDFAGVNLWDSDGTFINSSERWPVPPLSLSDRNYFKAFKNGSNQSPILIEMVES